jgi:hypothetical protein
MKRNILMLLMAVVVLSALALTIKIMHWQGMGVVIVLLFGAAILLLLTMIKFLSKP